MRDCGDDRAVVLLRMLDQDKTRRGSVLGRARGRERGSVTESAIVWGLDVSEIQG